MSRISGMLERAVKKILMAHDLSRRSSIALERAVQLARQHRTDLDILHIVDDDLPAAVIERRRSEATHVIEGSCPQVCAFPAGRPSTS
jgi:nucleotide-binding universal stress UspA family protein